MERVSKKLALIAKEKGWLTGSDEDWYYGITYYELITWIFSNLISPHKLSYTSQQAIHNIEWLEFWYTALLSELIQFPCKEDEEVGVPIDIINELVLEGFVGMLINWFESNNYFIHMFPNENDNTFKREWATKIYNLWLEGDEEETHYNCTVGDYSTKKQARHEGISKCFKLLKEQYQL